MSEYTITLERQQFIKRNFLEWSFKNPRIKSPNFDLFKQLQHPAELHYLANIYNWDDNVIVLEWILESQYCTRSTANLLFWRSCPDYFIEDDISDDGSPRENWEDGIRVLNKIIEKYSNNDFPEYQIYYDPGNDIVKIECDEPEWQVPPGVYDIIDGTHVMIEDGYF